MKRLRLGFFAVTVLGAFFVWILSKQFHGLTWPELLEFYLRVLFAPITVVWLSAGHEPDPVLIFSLLAIGGVAASWRFKHVGGRIAAIVGFAAWIFCEIVVAASAT